jgi:ADP-ribose pyrophosphatase YjhB (NUDIX family)
LLCLVNQQNATLQRAPIMNFCSHCGTQVRIEVPAGDNRPRHVCPDCHTVHYQNPKMVVGCIPEWEDKILLCRRAIEPKYGLWTLPAGFMENGETAGEGAARETLEEAGARVEILNLYSMISLPDINQVYLVFRAKLLHLDFTPGEESLEAGLFTESEIPWDKLAFRTIHHTLKQYYADRTESIYPLHVSAIFHKTQ